MVIVRAEQMVRAGPACITKKMDRQEADPLEVRGGGLGVRGRQGRGHGHTWSWGLWGIKGPSMVCMVMVRAGQMWR